MNSNCSAKTCIDGVKKISSVFWWQKTLELGESRGKRDVKRGVCSCCLTWGVVSCEGRLPPVEGGEGVEGVPEEHYELALVGTLGQVTQDVVCLEQLMLSWTNANTKHHDISSEQKICLLPMKNTLFAVLKNHYMRFQLETFNHGI